MQRAALRLAFVLGLFASPEILAQALPSVATRTLTGTVGVTSDFVFRGLSYTRGKPAGFASLDVEFASGGYLGGFLSSADPNPGPSPLFEVDVWLGRHWRISPRLSADLRLTHYMYPDDPRVADYDRDEFAATFGLHDAVFLSAIFSPNTDAIGSTAGTSRGNVWAVELSARKPLGSRFALTLGLGHYHLDQAYGEDYLYWNATLAADLHPFEIQLAFLGSDDEAERLFTTRSAGDRFAVTALYRFTTTR